MIRFIAVALLVVGCPRPTDTTQRISPEDARNAVVAFVREHPEEFFRPPEPEILVQLPLTDMHDGTWTFGGFTVDPKKRQYSYFVDVDATESYLYEGDLVTHDGKVTALQPRATRYHAATTDAG